MSQQSNKGSLERFQLYNKNDHKFAAIADNIFNGQSLDEIQHINFRYLPHLDK